MGAAFGGLYMEGPFLSPDAMGTISDKTRRDPDTDLLQEILQEMVLCLRIMTVAPDVPGATDLIERLAQNGVTPAIGHTACNYEQARAAIDAGARHTTHLFNAMTPWDKRSPGPVGAILEDDRVTAELICDGVHIHPSAIAMAARLLGPDRTVLTTDATKHSGLVDRNDLPSGTPRKKGRLAGSALTLNVGLANFMTFADVDLPTAVRAASLNPARAAGLDDTVGSLEVGKQADIVLFDNRFEPFITIRHGQVIYRRPEEY
jgi:N-acetylglucosamine-6-phosphate deacetylase